MSIEWIIFDLGGVVIDVDFDQFFTALPANVKDVVAARRADVVKAFGEYESGSGSIPPAVLFDSLREIFGCSVEDQQIVTAVNAVLGKEKGEVCSLIKDLSARYRIACLSNTNHIHWEVLTTKYPVFDHFELTLASHMLGYSKPDPRIYSEAQKQFGSAPEALFFIDDKPENVRAARDLRWNAAVYSDYASLERDLSQAGVA